MQKSKHREYGVLKTTISVSLTPEAVDGLDRIAKSLNVSRSKAVEMIGRGEVSVDLAGDKTLGELSAS